RGLDAVVDAIAQRAPGITARFAARHRLQLDLEGGQRLADIVVQVAREAAALFFLHLEQAARQRAQALVRPLELAVQPLERELGALALGDVADEDQARWPAAPAHQVAVAIDPDHVDA